jgi:hypothetical protein
MWPEYVEDQDEILQRRKDKFVFQVISAVREMPKRSGQNTIPKPIAIAQAPICTPHVGFSYSPSSM